MIKNINYAKITSDVIGKITGSISQKDIMKRQADRKKRRDG